MHGMLSRRSLLTGSIASALAPSALKVAFRNDTLDLVSNAVASLLGSSAGAPQDEDFWSQITEAFTLDRNIVNFNNGGCSPAPRIVHEALKRQLDFSNQAPSDFMWRVLEPEVENVRTRLARLFGCDRDEIALTRNASESLETLILGHDLQAGDEFIVTTLDYPRMITAIQTRERRDGIKMVQVQIPAISKSWEDIVKAIEAAITPNTKLMNISQVSFLNGQIFPIHDIVKMAAKHGVPVIVDGAHAFVQYNFTNRDLECDMYGTSLHKWLMAPIGTGALYVKKSHIPHVWPLMAANKTQDNDIRKFEEIGTHPAANHNAVGEAITFHEMIGGARKEARLRYLRHRWTDKLVDLPNIQFQTNLDPKHSCALTTVGIKGIKPGDLGAWLLSKYGIFVVGIVNPEVNGIRVTPNVYTTPQEVDRFAEAMTIAATKGIG
jgi:selenocysteine lyase/cysteine desulfurase